MREYLFRGQENYDKQWVFGSLLVQNGEWDKNGNMNMEYRILGKRGENDCVIPETVGQYVGATDKNGKKMFEGDIVRVERRFGVGKAHFDVAVVVDNSTLSEGGNGRQWRPQDTVYLEVIGNVHDNPELIEV